ncbi:peptide-N4-(N-acetyl-beta-glucosaminyl)asparagine amidase A-like [Nicotiana tabacum]|uniref:Peptide-N4-(N-acetyl-beta- glucosaminyl)asparagine amidase A-like n=1 Tax=Nicotiana tabacum TaxID=4097 RepID=A0A1S3ZFZ4_TOBAC|nr:PREDICTED: peptide-N4-(N-acetyl-beta-glucosaminyl)asparagine amidase A-like [Nicotiana tabacum]
MALSFFSLFFFFTCFSVLQLSHFSIARLHNAALSRSQLTAQLDSLSKNDTPTTYFEVTKPINLPKTKPCSYLLLKHDFGYTYGKPPVLANYTPPSNCPSQNFSKIVLEWRATSKGRQFDRIFGLWLGGIEIFRSCTAEPRPNGIVWTVKKDITRYCSLLMTNQTLAVYIGNIVDTTYTGVYHVKIFVHFYPADKELTLDKSFNKGFDSGADLVIPISRNLPLNDGLWFEIENSTDVQSKEFKIPQNAYRAVLEIYVSFHENDEFWYGNLPNDYITANNRTDMQGNGAFREVIVSLDDVVVGAVWPFTVVYTGGINPLLWRPISGIGSFNLPSYDIEVTPLLGKILDGSIHKISFSVTNALNVWYIDANLHLWLDKKSVKTQGKLLEYSNLPLSFSLASNFKGLDGSFVTNARRSISLNGWVKSSYGKITTRSSQDLSYSNKIVMGNEANLQIVDQTIDFNDNVYAKTPSFSGHVLESFKKFQFHLYSDGVEIGDKSYASISNVSLIFDEKRLKGFKNGTSTSSIQNVQKAQGYMFLKDQSIVNGVGSTQQTYKYDENSGCYFRNISSSNYTVIFDKVSNSCSKTTQSQW